MIVRLSLLVAATIAAIAARQHSIKNSGSSASTGRHSENGEANSNHQSEKEDKERLTYSNDSLREKHKEEEEEEEEEDEEEVKLISSVFNHASDISPGDIQDEDILPEFEDLLSGEIEIPLLVNKTDTKEKDIYETEMANNASELEHLRNLVKELEEREVKLEGELLEYYGLKEQESDVDELQRQLKIKTVEIGMLNITINSLQEERKKLQEELTQGASTKKELEAARYKIKELQRQIQLDANQTKGQLLLLKQQVTNLQAKEEEAVKKDAEIEKKLKAVNQLEVEVVELKRKNKELQIEKRELTIKLDAAEARVAMLSNMTETEMVANVREEVNNLKHANEDLSKQVEGLQMNRFSEVEELVYLRWVNACLRYELRNYQTPQGKVSARDLNKNLSPKSWEKAKQLMLEYAGSERGQGDTDLESNFSHPSSPGSEDFDNVSIDSSTSRYSSLSKKPSLMQKLKRWGKSKDDSSVLSSPARSLSGGSPSRPSMSVRPRGPLESLMIRNASDGVAITTFGKMDPELNDSPQTPTLPNIRTQISSSDSPNSVASSFQLMSKSVEGVLDEKYPAYKDRHKLALEREKQIKERAEQARVEKFGDKSSVNLSYKPRAKAEKERSVALPPKLAHIKEKAVISSDSSNQTLKDNVDMLKLIQLGLTFSDEQGNFPSCGTDKQCIWQFNFREFNLNKDVFSSDSIELLRQSGIDFKKNNEKGIDAKRFGELLMSSGIVLNDNVHWVTFHSGYDFGYLLKLLTCQNSPQTQAGFFNLINIYFPKIYDIKHLMKFCNSLHGGLNKLAELLEVERVGICHQAGSDSLLTSCTFRKLKESFFSGSMEKYAGVLYGLGVDNGQDTF